MSLNNCFLSKKLCPYPIYTDRDIELPPLLEALSYACCLIEEEVEKKRSPGKISKQEFRLDGILINKPDRWKFCIFFGFEKESDKLPDSDIFVFYVDISKTEDVFVARLVCENDTPHKDPSELSEAELLNLEQDARYEAIKFFCSKDAEKTKKRLFDSHQKYKEFEAKLFDPGYSIFVSETEERFEKNEDYSSNKGFLPEEDFYTAFVVRDQNSLKGGEVIRVVFFKDNNIRFYRGKLKGGYFVKPPVELAVDCKFQSFVESTPPYLLKGKVFLKEIEAAKKEAETILKGMMLK